MKPTQTKPAMPMAYDYEEAKRLSRDGDKKTRHAIASHDDTQPEILYYLAEDRDPDIRCCIAKNAKSPRQTDLILARDKDENVRCFLAEKIGHLFPKTSSAQRAVMQRAVLETLEVLAADQATRVRAILAEALKDIVDAPAELVLQLASDPEISVCGPILEFSPILTSEDLIALIESAPVQGALTAISRRNVVAEVVSDAIVGARDNDAIAALLANPSAQICEETLDQLIEDAPQNEAWHEPLVHRPKLPLGPARRVAGFVTRTLLDSLRQRTDLDAQTMAAIAEAVETRLSKEDAPNTDSGTPDQASWSCEIDPKRRAMLMYNAGAIDETSISMAASEGDTKFVIAALALCGTLAEATVAHVFATKSPKGIVALCWKSGFTMQLAIRLQFTMGNISPREVLRSKKSSDFPITEKEMAWQIEFFEQSGGRTGRTGER
jgi:uncharacterized protein (DUF2336 family)